MEKKKIDLYIGLYGLLFWLALILAIIINEQPAWIGLGLVMTGYIWRMYVLSRIK